MEMDVEPVREAPSALEKLGYLFYVVNPKRSSFERVEDVPNYVKEVVPFFAVLILLEFLVARWKKKRTMRVNDAFGSISQGMLEEISKVFFRGVQLAAYIYVYENWRLLTLPWNSTWTWLLCFLGADLGYYWMHRASHEINILWAAHQVHHSSEEYNLTTALRQSVLQYYLGWVFYLPLALAIPPSVFLVHSEFNLLYQFWIHTEIINKLGPLEYVLNTPSHHRVHHGRNRYCIDKNYAGVLIIWDRLFGTFEPEGKEVVYGLTHPINTFDPFRIQLCHYLHIWRTFWETSGFWNKLSVIFKGPGWSPGKPWHGLIEDIPDVSAPCERYDPEIPLWLKVYGFLHFVLVILGHVEITERHGELSQLVVLGAILYQIFCLTSFGALMDQRYYAPILELLRCSLFLFVDMYFLPVSRLAALPSTAKWVVTNLLRISFASSALFWLYCCIKTITVQFYVKKIE